nr:hypothetical protein [Zea mays]
MDGARVLIAASATAVCCLACAVWIFRSSSSSFPASSNKHQPPPANFCGCAS